MKEQDLWSRVPGRSKVSRSHHFSLFGADLFGHLGHTLLLSPPLSCSSKAKLLAFSPLPPPPTLTGRIKAAPCPHQVTTNLSLSPASSKPVQWMVPAASLLAKGLGNSSGQCPQERGRGSPRRQMGALLSAWTPSSPGEGLVCLRGGYLEHSPLCMCVCLLGGRSSLVLLPQRPSLEAPGTISRLRSPALRVSVCSCLWPWWERKGEMGLGGVERWEGWDRVGGWLMGGD